MDLIVLIVSVMAYLSIGLFIVFHQSKSDTNRLFFIFTITSALWSIVHYLSLHQSSGPQTLNLIRLEMAMAIYYSLALFLTIHTFPSKKLILSPSRVFILVLWTTAIAILTQTDIIFSSIIGHGLNAQPVPGIGIGLFGLTAGGYIVGSIYLLVKRYRHSSGVVRSQLQYLILGVVGSALMIFLTNFFFVVVFGNTSLLSYGPSFTLIFIVSTAYAIVAHQLFDIRVIIRKTVIYSGLLLFAVVVYSMIVYFFAALFGRQDVFNAQTFVINLVAATLIAVGFEPLRNILVRLTDKHLFVGEYNASTVLAELAQTLNSVLDLDEALQAMMKILAGALRVSRVATLILKSEENGTLIIKRAEAIGYQSKSVLSLAPISPLIQHFSKTVPNSVLPNIFITTDLESGTVDGEKSDEISDAINAELKKVGAALAVPIRVADKLIGILLVGPKLSGDIFSHDDLQFLDIVAKQTAAAIEKSRFYEDDQLKSEFVSIASHELLTPTAAIEGYLSMILDEKMARVDPKAEGYLRKVQHSARRLAELVTDLLSVSRIESGRIAINKQTVDLWPLVTETVEELKVKAVESGIQLSYLAPPQPLPKVLADPDRVIQVLTNLISNAIKYNRPNGSVVVSTAISQSAVTLHVSDSGIGIGAAHLPHLFEKFYRVHDDSAATQKIGTGLGLYITRSIVELMGGKISVASQPGRGSTFSFTIPVA